MSPAEPLTIVKLGGSVLTRKREEARLRPKLIARLASELAEAPRGGLLLLHGAGSFGHPGALRWRLAEPPAPGSGPARARGAAIVSAEVRRLHARVLAALLDAGLNPWSIPPSAVALQRAGSLLRIDPAPFSEAIGRGLLPVAFGDVVADEEWGFSILSADTLSVRLAAALGARRVLFVSDVEGILKPPGRAGGRRAVYETVTPELVETLTPGAGAPDVTGGIRGKARAMVELAALGVDAGLISGLRHGALSRAVRGETVYGSWSGPGPARPGVAGPAA